MIVQRLRRLLASRASLIYLISEEEERVERIVGSAAKKVLGDSVVLYTWSCTNGLARGSEVVDGSPDPVDGLRTYVSQKDNSVLIFNDLHLLIPNNARLIRKLKECARNLRTSKRAIFFPAPDLVLPQELYSVFRIEDVPLPSYDELARLLDIVIDQHPKAASVRTSLTDELKDRIVVAAKGFTANQAMEAFKASVVQEETISAGTVDYVMSEKAALVRKSGVLEFVDVSTGSWEIGGLTNLKKWLSERGRAFSPDAAKRGLTPPKGILAMGVSGCGKSLCIKAVAAYWKIPLLRLDMGLIYDGLAGPPEEAMRKAIKTSEALAPCVLWIDEIEAGIANQEQKAAGGSESRVMAQFLTWMQEKTAAVFVGATANEVEALPPEILRKGRFDELFYVGLPSKEERKQILSIHMKRRKLNVKKFDLDYLAQSTDGLNGAEIEQGVISGVYEAMSQNTELTEHILANCLRNIVPLSRTMKERIQQIEAWARDRAVKASMSSFGKN